MNHGIGISSTNRREFIVGRYTEEFSDSDSSVASSLRADSPIISTSIGTTPAIINSRQIDSISLSATTSISDLRGFISGLKAAYASREMIERVSDKEMPKTSVLTSYTRLTLISGEKNIERKTIEPDEIFAVVPGETVLPKRAYLDGVAGSGKSTFCKYIAVSWAKKSPSFFSKRFGNFNGSKSIIWVPLRRIKELIEQSESEKKSLGWLLKKIYFTEIDVETQAIDSYLSELERRNELFYLIDGFDEVRGLDKEQSQRGELVRALLNKTSYLLTSRPENVHLEAYKPIRQIEIKGFNKGQRERYISQYVTDYQEDFPDGKRSAVNDICEIIALNPNLKKTAKIPITLELICSYIRTNRIQKSQCISTTSLYGSITNALLDKFKERNQLIAEKIGGVIFFKKLGWLASANDSLYLSPLSIREVLDSLGVLHQDQENYLRCVLNDSGLLRKEGHIDDQTASCYFLHKTFQEYFAAQFLVDMLQSESDEAPYYDNLSRGSWTASSFITHFRIHPEYEQLFLFTVGLIKTTKLLENFYGLILSGRTFHEYHRDLVALNSFAEANELVGAQMKPQMALLLVKWLNKGVCLPVDRVERRYILANLRGGAILFNEKEVQDSILRLQDQYKGQAELFVSKFKSFSSILIKKPVNYLNHPFFMLRVRAMRVLSTRCVEIRNARRKAKESEDKQQTQSQEQIEETSLEELPHPSTIKTNSEASLPLKSSLSIIKFDTADLGVELERFSGGLFLEESEEGEELFPLRPESSALAQSEELKEENIEEVGIDFSDEDLKLLTTAIRKAVNEQNPVLKKAAADCIEMLQGGEFIKEMVLLYETSVISIEELETYLENNRDSQYFDFFLNHLTNSTNSSHKLAGLVGIKTLKSVCEELLWLHIDRIIEYAQERPLPKEAGLKNRMVSEIISYFTTQEKNFNRNPNISKKISVYNREKVNAYILKLLCKSAHVDDLDAVVQALHDYICFSDTLKEFIKQLYTISPSSCTAFSKYLQPKTRSDILLIFIEMVGELKLYTLEKEVCMLSTQRIGRNVESRCIEAIDKLWKASNENLTSDVFALLQLLMKPNTLNRQEICERIVRRNDPRLEEFMNQNLEKYPYLFTSNPAILTIFCSLLKRRITSGNSSLVWTTYDKMHRLIKQLSRTNQIPMLFELLEISQLAGFEKFFSIADDILRNPLSEGQMVELLNKIHQSGFDALKSIYYKKVITKYERDIRRPFCESDYKFPALLLTVFSYLHSVIKHESPLQGDTRAIIYRMTRFLTIYHLELLDEINPFELFNDISGLESFEFSIQKVCLEDFQFAKKLFYSLKSRLSVNDKKLVLKTVAKIDTPDVLQFLLDEFSSPANRDIEKIFFLSALYECFQDDQRVQQLLLAHSRSSDLSKLIELVLNNKPCNYEMIDKLFESSSYREDASSLRFAIPLDDHPHILYDILLKRSCFAIVVDLVTKLNLAPTAYISDSYQYVIPPPADESLGSFKAYLIYIVKQCNIQLSKKLIIELRPHLQESEEVSFLTERPEVGYLLAEHGSLSLLPPIIDLLDIVPQPHFYSELVELVKAILNKEAVENGRKVDLVRLIFQKLDAWAVADLSEKFGTIVQVLLEIEEPTSRSLILEELRSRSVYSSAGSEVQMHRFLLREHYLGDEKGASETFAVNGEQISMYLKSSSLSTRRSAHLLAVRNHIDVPIEGYVELAENGKVGIAFLKQINSIDRPLGKEISKRLIDKCHSFGLDEIVALYFDDQSTDDEINFTGQKLAEHLRSDRFTQILSSEIFKIHNSQQMKLYSVIVKHSSRSVTANIFHVTKILNNSLDFESYNKIYHDPENIKKRDIIQKLFSALPYSKEAELTALDFILGDDPSYVNTAKNWIERFLVEIKINSDTLTTIIKILIKYYKIREESSLFSRIYFAMQSDEYLGTWSDTLFHLFARKLFVDANESVTLLDYLCDKDSPIHDAKTTLAVFDLMSNNTTLQVSELRQESIEFLIRYLEKNDLFDKHLSLAYFLMKKAKGDLFCSICYHLMALPRQVAFPFKISMRHSEVSISILIEKCVLLGENRRGVGLAHFEGLAKKANSRGESPYPLFSDKAAAILLNRLSSRYKSFHIFPELIKFIYPRFSGEMQLLFLVAVSRLQHTYRNSEKIQKQFEEQVFQVFADALKPSDFLTILSLLSNGKQAEQFIGVVSFLSSLITGKSRYLHVEEPYFDFYRTSKFIDPFSRTENENSFKLDDATFRSVVDKLTSDCLSLDLSLPLFYQLYEGSSAHQKFYSLTKVVQLLKVGKSDWYKSSSLDRLLDSPKIHRMIKNFVPEDRFFDVVQDLIECKVIYESIYTGILYSNYFFLASLKSLLKDFIKIDFPILTVLKIIHQLGSKAEYHDAIFIDPPLSDSAPLLIDTFLMKQDLRADALYLLKGLSEPRTTDQNRLDILKIAMENHASFSMKQMGYVAEILSKVSSPDINRDPILLKVMNSFPYASQKRNALAQNFLVNFVINPLLEASTRFSIYKKLFASRQLSRELARKTTENFSTLQLSFFAENRQEIADFLNFQLKNLNLLTQFQRTFLLNLFSHFHCQFVHDEQATAELFNDLHNLIASAVFDNSPLDVISKSFTQIALTERSSTGLLAIGELLVKSRKKSAFKKILNMVYSTCHPIPNPFTVKTIGLIQRFSKELFMLDSREKVKNENDVLENSVDSASEIDESDLLLQVNEDAQETDSEIAALFLKLLESISYKNLPDSEVEIIASLVKDKNSLLCDLFYSFCRSKREIFQVAPPLLRKIKLLLLDFRSSDYHRLDFWKILTDHDLTCPEQEKPLLREYFSIKEVNSAIIQYISVEKRDSKFKTFLNDQLKLIIQSKKVTQPTIDEFLIQAVDTLKKLHQTPKRLQLLKSPQLPVLAALIPTENIFKLYPEGKPRSDYSAEVVQEIQFANILLTYHIKETGLRINEVDSGLFYIFDGKAVAFPESFKSEYWDEMLSLWVRLG